MIPSSLKELLMVWRANQEKLILVTGVFDLLHSEHIAFLKAAKDAGDHLVVGLESDVRVRALKGEGRPVQTLAVRMRALKDLGFVDYVFDLPEQFSTKEDHEQLISEILPTALAVSSHTAHLSKKRAILAKYGGAVLVVREQNPAVSTSKIVASK